MIDHLRIANFVDSSLDALERKGNLSSALQLYNPGKAAECVVHFTSHPGDVAHGASFARVGVEIFPFFANTGGNLSRMLRAPLALLRVIRKMRREGITVVRGRLPYFGSLIGCLAARVLGIPTIVSLGGDNRLPQELEGRYYFGSRFISYGMESAVLRLCDRIISPNQFTTHYVAKIIGERAARKKCVVIPWILPESPETADFATLERCAGPFSGKPVVAVVGHINRYKFSPQMFRLARQMADRAQFIFCGDGLLRKEGEDALAGTGTSFVGWQPNAVVRALLQHAHVALVPMSGFVLLEAASLGRPVVTSNLEWHSELVTHGESGMLVNPESEAEWSAALTTLLDQPELRHRCGQRLAARFEEDYSPARLVDRELKMYAELLGRPFPGRAS